MKKWLSALCAITLFAAVPTFTGCTTASKTLVTTVQTVDGAMKGWATWVALGNANATQEAQVKAMYEKYQASEAIAETALIASIKSGDKTVWTVASATLRDNQAALLALVNSFQTPTAKKQ